MILVSQGQIPFGHSVYRQKYYQISNKDGQRERKEQNKHANKQTNQKMNYKTGIKS